MFACRAIIHTYNELFFQLKVKNHLEFTNLRNSKSLWQERVAEKLIKAAWCLKNTCFLIILALEESNSVGFQRKLC